MFLVTQAGLGLMTGVEHAFWHLYAADVLDLPACWLPALTH